MRTPPIFAALVLSAALAGPGAAAPRPWTSDDILALKTVSDPRLSPDGRWVAYVVSELNHDGSEYQTDVCLEPTEGDGARLHNGTATDDE